ncbi:Transmembrane protein 40 isoform X1 [Aix galericulata]|nr:Transmembrane protein 40 isoform X1 [Aix galericulata]
MENLNGPFPELTEEQQDVFQGAFTADDDYLQNHEKMNQSFWESLVKCLATTDPPILNTEEKNNLLKRCSVLPGGCAACLKAIQTKGVRAMVVLYLLLKSTNPSVYRQLPSSKRNDEKLKLLKRLERNLMLSQGDKKADDSSHESIDEDPQDEFFHFVILCFGIGALLICYYYYKDWTISLGIGLITFASLETTGIYFGLGKARSKEG